ncbi:MAG: heparinase II/III family protein, partial [Planctomycetota bacterium]
FDADLLPALRAKAERPGWRPHMGMLRGRARAALERAPEADVGDFVPWTDYRYLRERERGRWSLWWDALDLGFVGLIDEDPAMLRHAGRFLMTLLHCRHWCQSAESRVRGSTWDSRCFLEEMSASTAAILLDWLDPLLTDRAKRLAHVALWDKGLAVIERDMMKYAYVYRINQGPWFCRARVLAGLMLEDAWPRVGTYVDRAMDDLLEGLNNYVLPDGGLDEGVGYFMMTMHTALPAVLAYAKARGKNARDLLPPQLAKSERYLRVMSAVRPGRFLPEADNSTDRVLSDGVGVLAGLYPEASAYRDILAECLGHEDPDSYFSQYMQQGMCSLIHGPDDVPPPRTIVPGFAELPGLGQLTSYREKDGRSLRVHLVGSPANPSGHTHRDKGNLLLELDGVPVLIDRGVPRYDDARKSAFEPAAIHNVLTPWAPDRGFLDQSHPKAAMPFTGQSEGDALHAEIDLTPAWAEGFSACSRAVASPDPDRLTLTDAGRMATPGHAVFHLHARAPFVIDEDARTAELTVEGVTLRIVTPWAERLKQREHLTDFALRPVYHLEAWSPAMAGEDVFRLTTDLRRL